MIARSVQAALLATGNVACHVPIEAEVVYDVNYNPLVVQLILSGSVEEVCWELSRECLVHGSSSLVPFGEGDVKIRYEGPGTNLVVVCLRGRLGETTVEGHADIGLNRSQLCEFLQETLTKLPLGEESLTDQLDELIDEILEGS